VVDLGGGVVCEVGTGLNDQDRKDPDWVGRIVEVEYLAVTKDGKLREPSFQRIRWDKKVPDVIGGNVVSED
jgi:ATP-dependent DNA ligase